ncbi:MAG: proline--tRNA ligase [Clostridia bacterium]|nr:proline--tRNA ligase [Clostridia bacterium]
MARQKEADFVTHIASRAHDFPQWYTDVILKADMVDYSIVKGCMVIKPYGYRVWELMQSEMDRRFKDTGHVNAYFPLLIPESLLQKEAEHVEGFAPEVAWVTHGGNQELQERLCIRPTSETIICSMYSKWIQSYRDLPLLINQWANVVRWEKSTRPFLRTSEFLWQEGHTAHATSDEARQEAATMLEVYKEFAENVLAIPVLTGQKSEKEKFAGAEATFAIEAMMQDGKALQMGTTHYLGDHFSRAYDITYLSKEGKLEYCYTTSWGTSTRMIGGVIMVHGDDRGLVLPPTIAPIQVAIVPVAQHKAGVLDKAYELHRELASLGYRVKVDASDQSAGWKFNEYELKGVPLRLEVGPKDIEKDQVVIVRRDTHDKLFVPIPQLADSIDELLKDVHATLLARALDFRENKTVNAVTMEELAAGVNGGFVRAMWCGDRACEDSIKAQTGATTRCTPPDELQIHLDTKCICCGREAERLTYFAKAY